MNGRITQFEQLFEKFPELDTKGNRKRYDSLRTTFAQIDKLPICGKEPQEDDGTAYGLTQSEQDVLAARSQQLASEGVDEPSAKKQKKPRKLSAYNLFMSHCMKGEEQFAGQGKSDFSTCVQSWKQNKGG